jgi:hypothetical protein
MTAGGVNAKDRWHCAAERRRAQPHGEFCARRTAKLVDADRMKPTLDPHRYNLDSVMPIARSNSAGLSATT